MENSVFIIFQCILPYGYVLERRANRTSKFFLTIQYVGYSLADEDETLFCRIRITFANVVVILNNFEHIVLFTRYTSWKIYAQNKRLTLCSLSKCLFLSWRRYYNIYLMFQLQFFRMSYRFFFHIIKCMLYKPILLHVLKPQQLKFSIYRTS